MAHAKEQLSGDLAYPRLPKLCGADAELGNFVLGLERTTDTCEEASRALLREIHGLPRVSRRHAAWCGCPACRIAWKGGYGRPAYSDFGTGPIVYDPQDRGRRFLSNGGCAYIDLNHLEVCLPEVLSARDHLAAWHAQLRVARRALQASNAKLPDGQKIQVLVNNSDGLGHSYGNHLNFLVTRRAWDNLFRRKLHLLLYLAAYQVSSIIFTGQGKVGSENGRPAVDFQLSQRADFFETLTGIQTTFNRPIVNSRDEPLCGPSTRTNPGEEPGRMARLHVIFYDSNLCHVAHFLKVGVLQILLAMIEQERVNPSLALDDPLDALIRWSHDPTLTATAATAAGLRLTATELQFLFLEEAKRFVSTGGCVDVVPEPDQIIRLWEDTLLKLEARDLPALVGRIDWALKLTLLQRAMEEREELNWKSPAIKHLDHIFSSLDATDGLYWCYERAGLIERLATDEKIHGLLNNPPEDTRAWTRAMVLREAGADKVVDVDWDTIRIRAGNAGTYSTRTVDLPSPIAFTRSSTEELFRQAGSLEEILNALAALGRHRPADAVEQGGKHAHKSSRSTGRPDSGPESEHR